MLRELATVLIEMQEALAPFVADASTLAGASSAPRTSDARVRLHDAFLELPLDLRVVLADGGARLEADVPRSLADSNWRDGASRLRLRLRIVAAPLEDDTEAAS